MYRMLIIEKNSRRAYHEVSVGSVGSVGSRITISNMVCVKGVKAQVR